MRSRGESGHRRPAGVQDVLVHVAEAHELALVEEGHHHAQVALVDRSGGVRVVAQEAVPGAQVLDRVPSKDGLGPTDGGGDVEGHEPCEGQLLRVAVKDAGAEVQGLGHHR